MKRIPTISLLGLLLLLSCNRDLAKICSETFPCRDSVTYIGIGVTDSIPYIEFDTLYQERIDTHYSFGTIEIDKPTQYIVKPVIRWKYIEREGKKEIIKVRDTAREKYLENKISELERKTQPKLNIPWWVWLILIAGGYGVYKLKK